MRDTLVKKSHYSVDEYEQLVRDSSSGERYEYYYGQIIPVEKYTSLDHNQIVHNTADQLKRHFYPQDCRVYTENIRLQVNAGAEYRLPDVMAACPSDTDSRYAITDPLVLAEVISPGTALQDLGVKLDSYRQMPSLQAYLIINPDLVWVRVYERAPGGQWLPDRLYTRISDNFHLEALALTISMGELYRFVRMA